MRKRKVIQVDDDIRVDIDKACIKCYCYTFDDCSDDCKLYNHCHDIADSRGSLVGDFDKWLLPELDAAMHVINGKGKVYNDYCIGIVGDLVDEPKIK